MRRGSVVRLTIALPLMICGTDGGVAGGDSDPIVETSHATIESRNGETLQVVFAAEGQPALLLKPVAGAWDWSLKSKLFVPVENPGDEPLALLLRIENEPGRSLTGKVAMAPHSTGDLAIWLGAPSPRAMGMIAGPSVRAGGMEPNTLPVTATDGSIDASRVISVRLGIARPATPRRLTVGALRVAPPSEADRTAYDGIVDAFGQFRPGSWAEKVSSAEMLRARGDEERQELKVWLANSPKLDHFGGLEGSGGFPTTGFF